MLMVLRKTVNDDAQITGKLHLQKMKYLEEVVRTIALLNGDGILPVKQLTNLESISWKLDSICKAFPKCQ